MKKLELPHRTADYLCPVNGLSDIYEWKTGKRLPEELIHGSRLGFQLISLEKAFPPKMIFWGQGTIGKDQFNYWKDLVGYNLIASEGKSFNQTLSEVKSLIDQNIPAVLFGLDMYHLPYHENFYHVQHIPGHVILMVGYDSQSVFIHDNSRDGVQVVPNSDLQKAWAQEYMGISKKNAYFGIDMCRPNNDIADIIQRGISRNADLYLNAPVDFIGTRGLEKLITELPVWKDRFSTEVIKQIYLHHVEFTASTVPELPEELSGFHSGIVNPHQAGRDKFADALLKYQSEFGTPKWEGVANQLHQSGKIIEAMIDYSIRDIRAMTFDNTDRLIPMLSQIKSIEKEAIGQLQMEKSILKNRESFDR